MSWLSFVFEGAVSVLLLVMIAYCVKLNRLLGGLRERDAEIKDLLIRFKAASDQAEASVATLKTVGIEVERSVRTATERAEAAHNDLVSLLDRGNRDVAWAGAGDTRTAGRTPAPAPPAPNYADDGPDSVYPAEFFERGDGSAESEGSSPNSGRSEAESDLMRAIRSARTGG